MKIKEKLQQFELKSYRLWLNKYTISLLCFVVWLLFFDKYNLSTQRKLTKSISKIEKEKVSFDEKIHETKLQLANIDENKEKYARERYYMHKPNEEIVVINPEEK